MKTTTLLTALALSASIGLSDAKTAYKLDTVMWGSTFFNNFNFITADSNNGYVKYLTKAAAQAAGLIYAAEGQPARISSDSKTTLSGAAGTGRNSVRIESTKSWTHGLFVFNIAAMPAPACGVWPALWMLGAGTWPSNGEIDLIEGVNLANRNLMSLHTSATCSVPKEPFSAMLGSWVGTNCDVSATNNAGCGVTSATADTYGAGMNSAGGGDLVMEWTSSFIKIWWYTRATLPADIKAGNPDQTKRGKPQAYWVGNQGCTLDNKIKSNRIVINTNFCGDYAGNAGIWKSASSCYAKSSTCNAYVAKNPKDYVNTKWLFNSIKVYTLQTVKKRADGEPEQQEIADPTLEFEELARATNVTITGEEELEIRTAEEEVKEPKRKRHLHRHLHQNGGVA